jgi:DNA-nicking Smr family endonuclease
MTDDETEKDKEKTTDKTVWEAYKKSVKPLKQSRKKPGLDLQKKIEITIQNHAPKTPDLKPNFEPSGGVASSNSLLYQSPKKIRRTTQIQARLDLHGMTQAQAIQALTSFIQRCYRNQQQNLLVITGKGTKPLHRTEMPDEESQKVLGGALRRNLPTWLEHPELRPYIHFYTFSHPFEGKTGACYVRLRKS